MKITSYTLYLVAAATMASCSSNKTTSESSATDTVQTGGLNQTVLPAPFSTPSSVKFAEVIGWPDNVTPKAPEGFTVTKFASGLNNPRWIYVAPNGDILVAEARTSKKGIKKVASKISGQAKSQNENNEESGNRILLFRDADNDGIPEVTNVFLSGLNKPLGMLIVADYFYVANTDGLWKYPYEPGATSITGQGMKILELPAGGYNNHWTRNIITNKEQNRIFISVGSGSNVGENGMEHEIRRANILTVNLDGSDEKIYASGLRNPVGMDWAPGSNQLWTAVNERDGLGDDLVPDYITSVKENGFYGWPYAYWGNHADPRMDSARMDLVGKSIVPDVDLGSHTASLGLAFNKTNYFPKAYTGGAFIGQHGSWNRSAIVGYKVVYVPFANGKPTGKPQDFLTGFIANQEKAEVYGRPVCIAFAKGNYMLVSDDAANTIWCVKSTSTR